MPVREASYSRTDPLSKTKTYSSVLLIVVGLLAGLVSFIHRWKAEARNRRVELVVDYGDAQALANTTQRPMDDVLTQLHGAGITTVAVTEDTLGTLNTNGVVDRTSATATTTVLTFAPGFPGQRARVVAMLAHKAPGLAVTPEGPDSLRVGAPWPQFSTLPIGLDDDAGRRRSGGTACWSRRACSTSRASRRTTSPGNWRRPERSARAAGHRAADLRRGAVLGNRGQIEATADALAADGLTYGSVEFGKTFGDDDLSRMAAGADRARPQHRHRRDGPMDEPTAIERFVRAARERNIRVCYVRLFTIGLTTDAGRDRMPTREFIGKIVKGMREARLTRRLMLGRRTRTTTTRRPAWSAPADGAGRDGRRAAAAARLHGH